jgi:CRISPR-associated protein Cas2
MIIWVLYDIKENRARTKAAKLCKKAGLYRVQQSCFLGTLDGVAERDTLQLQLETLLDEQVDKVYIFSMNRQELQQTVLLGQAFDKRLVTDEIQALFL